MITTRQKKNEDKSEEKYSTKTNIQSYKENGTNDTDNKATTLKLKRKKAEKITPNTYNVCTGTFSIRFILFINENYFIQK